MAKNVNSPSRAKATDRGKQAGQGDRSAVRTDLPAQEIAEDEVEIAKTGGKPGEGRRPVAGDKP